MLGKQPLIESLRQDVGPRFDGMERLLQKSEIEVRHDRYQPDGLSHQP